MLLILGTGSAPDARGTAYSSLDVSAQRKQNMPLLARPGGPSGDIGKGGLVPNGGHAYTAATINRGGGYG